VSAGVTRAPAIALAAVALAVTAAGCGGSSDPHRAGARPRHHGSHTAAAATGAAGAAAAAAVRGSGPHPQLGPFAGYDWNGTVRSARADWTVPQVTAATPAGQAAAWVGAEAPGRTGHAPFVQVGVHEGNSGGPAGTPSVFYYAFYSTTKLGFRPKLLFEVQPGDVVSATLRRAGSRWRVELQDLTTGRRRAVTTVEGAGRVFNEAQFNQEDVTDSRTDRPYPYPSLTTLRFSGVSVNGGPPAAARLNSSWLTEADGYLAPGPLRRGAFALRHASMTKAGYRYLRQIAAQDAATTGGMTSLVRWASAGGSGSAFAEAGRLAAVLHGTATKLGATRWPRPARPAISAVRSDARRLVGLLREIREVPADERVAWAERFYALVAALGREGRVARAALGLPSSAVLPPG
jgi:hypothetical protein